MTQRHIQHVLDGKTEAFRFIINDHKDRAFAIAMSVVKNEFTAKEVVQTAFIKAYTKLDTFRSDAKFSTWLHRIVINEAFKKHNNQTHEYTALDEVNPDTLSPETNQTFAKMSADHRQFYVNRTLKQMPAKHSLALRLFYLQEYSLKEVSSVTGWSNANTKVILYRARKKMKSLLSELMNVNQEELF